MSNTQNEEGDLILARLYFEKIGTQETAVNNLKILTTGKESKPIYKAYLGAAYCAEAKYRWNPYTKLDRVKVGMNLINDAAVAEASNIEIRFLRFCIEENLPITLPYKEHLTNDKIFLLKHINQSHSYYATMKSYLLKSKLLTASEKLQL